MSVISLDQHSYHPLPCSEQLNRLRQLGVHLRRFLARYYCEPQTRDRFLQREALREQIRELEEKCARISEQQRQEKKIVSRIAEEVIKLNLEFKRLEDRVQNYMQGYS